jgi:hypothetical protein
MADTETTPRDAATREDSDEPQETDVRTVGDMLISGGADETSEEPVIVIAGGEPAEQGYDHEVALARAKAALGDALSAHEQSGDAEPDGIKGFISRVRGKFED